MRSACACWPTVCPPSPPWMGSWAWISFGIGRRRLTFGRGKSPSLEFARPAAHYGLQDPLQPGVMSSVCPICADCFGKQECPLGRLPLNPGLIPQSLDDLRQIAPDRTEMDDELVGRWNRLGE